MKRKITNSSKTKINYFVAVALITVLGAIHSTTSPINNPGIYHLIFAAVYAVLALISLVCIFILPRNWKIFAFVNFIFAVTVFGYDVFAMAFSSYTF